MGQSEIAGTEAHHAIEMLLKGNLLGVTTEEERRKIGHNLRAAWRKGVKRGIVFPRSAVPAAVERLQAFEAIRYPEAIFRSGAEMRLGWVLDQGVSLIEGKPSTLPRYDLVMGEVDELADQLLTLARPNPLILSGNLSKDAWRYLTERNDHLIFWDPVPV